MATAARLPLAAWRNELCVRTIKFVGIDLTGVDMRAQVRLRPDTPGAPLISLATVTTAAAEGLKLDGVATVGGVPTSTVILRINKATMQDPAKVPYGGEAGADTTLAYAIQFGGVTRVVGQFVALASVMDSDGAQAGTVSGYGAAAGGSLPWNGAQLTFSDETIRIAIDGADLLAPIVSGLATQVAAITETATGVVQAQAALDAVIAKAGYRYNYVTTPTLFTDAGSTVDKGSRIEKTPFAKTIIETSATSLRVHGYNTLATQFETLRDIGVRINGVYDRSLHAPGIGPFDVTLADLAAGPKVIEFIDGPRALVDTTVQGIYFVSIEGNTPVPQLFPAAVNRTAFNIDSIGAGDGAIPAPQKGWVGRIDGVTTDSVVTIGYGKNTFAETCGNTYGNTVRNANVAQLVGLAPTRIVNALGTNDWALVTFTPTLLTQAYGLWLDAVHAALPAVQIIVLTPIIRGGGTPEGSQNGQGFTIQQFRDAITAACAGRSYVTVIDGKAIMTVNDLADGTHPNNKGHLLIAQAVGTALGYTVPNDPVSYAPLNAGPDTNGSVTTPSAGLYRYTKTGGGNGFNAGLFGPPLTTDLRYQIDVPNAVDLIIGVDPDPTGSSGIGTARAIYLSGGGGVSAYDGGAAGSSLGSWTPGTTAARFFFDRTGSAVTIRQGADYASATTLRGPFTMTGALGLDGSMFQVGGVVDVKRLV